MNVVNIANQASMSYITTLSKKSNETQQSGLFFRIQHSFICELKIIQNRNSQIPASFFVIFLLQRPHYCYVNPFALYLPIL